MRTNGPNPYALQRTLLIVAWFFIAATAALVAVTAIVGILAEGRSAAGSPAPLAGVANLILIGAAVGGVVVFCAAYFFRPRRLLSPQTVAASAAIYLVALTVTFWAVRSAGAETIRLQVLDSGRKPIPEATISYRSSPRGQDFGVSQSTVTDSAGLASISSDHRHVTEGTVTATNFIEVTFHLDRDWGGGRRQTTMSWRDPTGVYRNPRTGDSMGAMVFTPAQRQTSLTVYLPRTFDDPLPYPQPKPE